jgi:hypothetical protein
LKYRINTVDKKKVCNYVYCQLKLNIMALYRISGVWKDNNSVITYYAFHEVTETRTKRAVKIEKSEAVNLLENGNQATTWVWNYKLAGFVKGEDVHVVDGENGKYLRSNPDSTVTDNLNHLINYNWIQPMGILRPAK